MKRIAINCELDYIVGHLRYGHEEGVIELLDDEYEDFKKDPDKFMYDHDEYFDDLSIVIDDYEIEDIGPRGPINYKEIN